MNKQKQSKNAEQLADLRRELGAVNLSLSIVGEHSESSGKLVAKRESILEKIRELESEPDL